MAVTASYTAASQLSSLQYGTNYGGPFTESRTYNTLMQTTRMTTTSYQGTLMDMQYNYTTGQNNGRVSSTTDNVLGETVNYTYDMWNRLSTATATNGTWGENYTFDNFGNLTGKTPSVGSAPSMNVPANNSNQPTGIGSFDANGNSLGGNPYYPNTWDVENRLVATATSTQSTTYSYDPWGRRIWKEIPGSGSTYTTAEVYFYGVTGQKLETYSATYTGGGFVMSLEGINVYFGKKLLQSKGAWVATDKLGSVRYNSSLGAINYFPFGEERTNTANGVEKFGTYTRDAVGQDYAEQRYYNSSMGAFWSPDPGGIATANSSDPTSWNRYAYVGGDPINHSDPSGMEQDLTCGPDWETDASLDGPCCNPGNQLLGAPPDPACLAGPPAGPAVPTVAPAPAVTCADILGIPSAVEAKQLAVLLGEDSWNLPGYSNSMVPLEDLYMLQAMYNLVVDGGYAGNAQTVSNSVNTDTYRGYPAGVTALYNDLAGPATSDGCLHLSVAEDAYAQFWSPGSSRDFSDVNQWRSAATHGPAGTGETQINGNVFYYNPGASYSPNRPHKRPTPPIRLPKPKKPRGQRRKRREQYTGNHRFGWHRALALCSEPDS